MMHKAWCSIEEVPFCFFRVIHKISRSHASKKRQNDPDWAFPDCNSSLNSPMATKWCIKPWSSIEEVPYCFSRSSVKFQGHMALKIVKFDPDWAFPDCISSLKSPMAKKWCTKLEVAWKRCPIVFEGHPSNFKVPRPQKIVKFDPNWAFRTVTPVSIHQWLWNAAQSLK